MTPPVYDSWRVAPSWEEGPLDLPIPLSEAVSKTRADLEGRPRDSSVEVPVGFLRDLLASVEDRQRTRVALIDDHSRRVTYGVTVGNRDDAVYVRRVTVSPWDEPPAPAAFKSPLPIQTLAEQAAIILEQTDDDTLLFSPHPDDETKLAYGWPAEPQAKGGGVPSPETLRAWVAKGLRRTAIAERAGRSPSTVDDWLRKARRERPDLDWPEPTRGPKPKASNSDRPRRDDKSEE